MKRNCKFKSSKVHPDFVACHIYYRDLATICFILSKSKFVFPQDSDLIDPLLDYFTSLLDHFDNA